MGHGGGEQLPDPPVPGPAVPEPSVERARARSRVPFAVVAVPAGRAAAGRSCRRQDVVVREGRRAGHRSARRVHLRRRRREAAVHREPVVTDRVLPVAGRATGANTIGTMVAMQLVDRRCRERPLAGRSFAVGEDLRFDAGQAAGVPCRLVARVPVADTAIPDGMTVMRGLAAADRDESAFDDAGRVHGGHPHVSSGAGARACPGRVPSRTGARAAPDVLFRRFLFANLAVPAGAPRRTGGLAVGGPVAFPVRW